MNTSKSQGTDNRQDELILLYTTNNEMAKIYLDWRSRVFRNYFLMVGALCIATFWIHSTENTREYASIPFCLGVLGSVLFMMVDYSVAKGLIKTLEVGQELEKKIASVDGIYTKMHDWYLSAWIKGTTIAMCAYGCSVILFLIGALWVNRIS